MLGKHFFHAMKIQPKILSLLSAAAGAVLMAAPAQAKDQPERTLTVDGGQDPKPCPTPQPTSPDTPPKPRPPNDPCLGCGRG